MSIMKLLPLAEEDLIKASGLGSECWHWEVKGNVAHAIYQDPQGRLVLLPWVEIINNLHELGWKRGGKPAMVGPDTWEVYAYLQHGDARVRVTGIADESDRPEGCTNPAVPFFAPDPPPLSRKKSFKAEYDAWLGRCHRDEW